MEKYTPHYDLAVIKADVRRLGRNAKPSVSRAWSVGSTLFQAGNAKPVATAFGTPIPIVRIAMQKRVMSWFSPREK